MGVDWVVLKNEDGGLDPYYYLGHSASNDHPPVNSWTSFMVVIALESPNEWQANLEPMSPCLFIFNGCGLSGAEKWGWWPRSLLLSRPLSFNWPPTSHQSILGLLSWFWHCFGISQWMTSQSRTNEPPVCSFSMGVDWVVLKNEDGGQDPYYLGHSASNDHPPVNSWTSFIVVIALESPNEWQANLEPMSPCLFIFNGCGLSGAEKWGWWPRSLLSRPLSFKWPPTSQFLDFFHGSVIALESPNEWQANLEPMSPCLFVFNGCGLSGAEKWGWWPRSLLSRPLSFK